MKIITPKLITLAAIGLLGASTVAQAHPQQHSQQHSRSLHSHKHSIANKSVQVIARLPAASVRIALNGQHYYTVGGKLYQRVNKGWRVVAAPASWRSAQRAEPRKRVH